MEATKQSPLTAPCVAARPDGHDASGLLHRFSNARLLLRNPFGFALFQVVF